MALVFDILLQSLNELSRSFDSCKFVLSLFNIGNVKNFVLKSKVIHDTKNISNIPTLFKVYSKKKNIDFSDTKLTGTAIDDKNEYEDISSNGSTWTQEMVWLIGNDFNYEEAKKTTQHTRAPLIEMSAILVDYSPLIEDKYGTSVDGVNNLPSPRYIRSHLPLDLLPTQLDKVKPKIIYVARNPKDMCISYYHHCKLLHNMDCTLEEFCEVLLNDKAPIGPIWRHFLAFWNKRHEPNIYFIKYEDLKRDLKGNIRKMAEFLEKSITDEQVDKLAEHLSFQNMRDNPAVNLQPIIDTMNGKDYYKRTGQNFIRKGEVGDWKNSLSPEMVMRFDKWIEENSRGTGLSFD